MDKRVQCKICFDEQPENSFIKLLCEHSYCKTCLLKDWTEKIEKKMVDDTILKCPSENCFIPINYYILRDNLPKEIFLKYDTLKTELFEIEIKSKEKVIICPNCNTLSVIWKDADYFKCPTCKKTWCAKENCFGDWLNHERLTCNEYKKKYDFSDADTFKLLVKAKSWNSCPKCHAVIEKIGNCNKVRCESMRCQKKTLFCYLCGQILIEADSASHFIKGEFGDQCINKLKAVVVLTDNNKENKINMNPNNDKLPSNNENQTNMISNTDKIPTNLGKNKNNDKNDLIININPNQEEEKRENYKNENLSITCWGWYSSCFKYVCLSCSKNNNNFQCPNCKKSHSFCCLGCCIYYRESYSKVKCPNPKCKSTNHKCFFCFGCTSRKEICRGDLISLREFENRFGLCKKCNIKVCLDCGDEVSDIKNTENYILDHFKKHPYPISSKNQDSKKSIFFYLYLKVNFL